MDTTINFQSIMGMVDIIIIILIVIVTIYTTWKTNKENGKWNKYTDTKAYIDEQKWFIVENSVKKNIEKYEKGKWFIKAFFSIPTLILSAIFLWVFIYNFVTSESNVEPPFDLIIFFILLLIFIFLFIYTKKTLDKIQKNLLYRIIIIVIGCFISLAIMFLWWFGSQIMCEKLNLSGRISSLIQLFCGFWSMILWLLSLSFFAGYPFFEKKSSKKNLDNNLTDDIQSDNDLIKDDQIDDEQRDQWLTYDEMMDANEKMEDETGFHQWPLFSDK